MKRSNFKKIALLVAMVALPIVGGAQKINESAAIRKQMKTEKKDSIRFAKEYQKQEALHWQRIHSALSDIYNVYAKETNAPLLPKMKLAKRKSILPKMKLAKRKSIQYVEQRQAVVLVMDSMLLHARTSEECRKSFGQVFYDKDLEKFADMICAKFGDDPVLMDSIAATFFGLYSNAFLGEKRFAELKKMHPNYVNAYYTEASLYHNLAWRKNEFRYNQFEPVYIKKAKEQIDSAKVLVPDSPEPYMRWIFMQGKNYPESVYPEIEALKAKLPNYPAYLLTARFFYEQSQQSDENKGLIFDARRCFSKAERDSMHLADYQLYANVCYRIASRTQRADYEECISVTEEGLKKFPNDIELLRMKLYSYSDLSSVPVIYMNGERTEQLTREEIKENRTKAYLVASELMALPNTAKFSSVDYKYFALANKETGRYTEAIKLLDKQIETRPGNKEEYALALLNKVECYNRLGQYNDAESAFSLFSTYKSKNGLELTISDYLKLLSAYTGIGGDTLLTSQKRMQAYVKADSVLDIMGKVSPDNIVYVNNFRLNVALNLAQLENSTMASPRILEASNRLVKSILDVKEEDRQANDWCYLITGMRYAMEYYLFTDKWAETWVCADKIMSLPATTELQGLSNTRASAYEQHRNRAQRIYETSMFAKRGKKLKGSWHPFE